MKIQKKNRKITTSVSQKIYKNNNSSSIRPPYFAQIKLGQENLTYDDFMKTFVPEVQAPVIGAPPLPNAPAAPK